MQRIVILGGPGVGKTTLAKAMAAKMGVAHIEVDTVRFVPGTWKKVDPDELLANVSALMADAEAKTGGWVMDTSLFDATDPSQGRARLIGAISDRVTRFLILACPDVEFALANVAARHASRVVAGGTVGTGAIETDADVLRLSTKMQGAWPAITAALVTAAALFGPKAVVHAEASFVHVGKFALCE
jgi:hypothetical protein